MKIEIALIRHGETENAAERLLVASYDPLSERGKRLILEKCAEKAYPVARRIYSSSFFCCRETAGLIYPPPIVILKELSALNCEDFEGDVLPEVLRGGDFVNGKVLYDAETKAIGVMNVIGSDAENGEDRKCAVISHKMIILGILRRYCVPRSSYADWEFPFGGGYMIEYDTAGATANLIRRI